MIHRYGHGRPETGSDRLPTRHELLNQIAWLLQVIDALVKDRERIARIAAELACEGAAA